MSSIANLFSNLNDLVKPKSVTDSASDYTKNDLNTDNNQENIQQNQPSNEINEADDLPF